MTPLQVSEIIRPIMTDPDLGMAHLCLFVALLQLNNYNGIGSIQCNRAVVMKLSKIKSKTTYHKCINDLITYGYINYYPTFHPKSGSCIYIVRHRL